jgi:anti-sigma factor RsiW
VTCQEFVSFVMAWLDGELTAGERASFDEHLAVCPDCVRYLDQYRDTVAAVQLEGGQLEGGRGDALPGGVPDDLVRAIIAARKRR